jgi:hypothetical protein
MKQKAEAGGTPVYTALWNPDSKFTFTALEDFAAAVFTVLCQREKHYSAIYEIVSMRKQSNYNDVCEVASARLGRQIQVQKMPFEQAVKTFIKIRGETSSASVNNQTVEIIERMLLDYEHRGLVGNPNVLEWLIGREGISLEGYFDGLGS